ncbi:protein-disulfide reductase DsbD [Pseudaeromonas paramecii]|uniref:Thiol:disulfide interchange protein DsbD n=1 Tax=Pseudaeromonas paramecii TaxID=2138166 RepID=A0ABP8Q910_9GAMM
MRLIPWLLCLVLLCIGPSRADELLDSLLAPSQRTPQYLPVERAFALSWQQEGDRVRVHFTLAPGYYLYRDKLSWQAQGAQLQAPTLPEAQAHEDDFFGETWVYYDQLDFSLPLTAVDEGAILSLRYQGCTEGLCYPPAQASLALTPVAPSVTQLAETTPDIAPQPVPPPATPDDTPLARGGAMGLLLFFVLGLGLSLTPCMFPMYPILSSLLLGNQGLSPRRGAWLALLYVQGMAITYSLLGLAIASLGAGLQAQLQQPWVLWGASGLFVLLALAMFGLYQLQLPGPLQGRLHQLTNRLPSGHGLGVLLMGALSALVCSPCTTAPLSGALLFVAQGGDRGYGAAALYLLSLGMGLPLLLIGAFGNRWLPRAGRWMEKVKTLFGFVLLAVPLLLLERLLPDWLIHVAALLLALGAISYLLKGWEPPKYPRLGKGALLLTLALLGGLWIAPRDEAPGLPFTQVAGLSGLQAALAQARQDGQPVLLDLYADWCVACRQYEEETFRDPAVQQALASYRLLRVDVTAASAENQQLLSQLQVFGLPALLFYGEGVDPVARLDGFVPPRRFVSHMETIFN